MKTNLLSIRTLLAIGVIVSTLACSSQRPSEQTIVTPIQYSNPPAEQTMSPAPSNEGIAAAPAPAAEDDDMTYAPDRPVASYQTFYDELTPYGRWVNYPNYGYVWSPNVEAGFHPYGTNGHWVYTRYGWTWASSYNWGWAPFHYGRWAYDASYGWLWTPGNVWGPAWVSWRQSNSYYGWAPLGPQVGVNVSLAFGSGYSCPADHYVFVPSHYINSPRVSEYYEDRHRNTTIINNTTIVNNYITNNNNSNNTTVINNRTYVAGPRLEHVQAATGARIQTVSVVESPRSGATVVNNNTVNIYRPRVSDPSAGQQRATPRNVVTVNNLQPIAQEHRLTPNTPSRVAPQNVPVALSVTNNVRNNNNVNLNNTNTANPVNRNNAYPANRAPQNTDPVYRNRSNDNPVNRAPQNTDPVYRNRSNDNPVNRAPQTSEPVKRERYQYNGNAPQRNPQTEGARIPNNPEKNPRVYDQRQRETAPQKQSVRVETPPVRTQPAREVEKKKDERR